MLFFFNLFGRQTLASSFFRCPRHTLISSFLNCGMECFVNLPLFQARITTQQFDTEEAGCVTGFKIFPCSGRCAINICPPIWIFNFFAFTSFRIAPELCWCKFTFQTVVRIHRIKAFSFFDPPPFFGAKLCQAGCRIPNLFQPYFTLLVGIARSHHPAATGGGFGFGKFRRDEQGCLVQKFVAASHRLGDSQPESLCAGENVPDGQSAFANDGRRFAIVTKRVAGMERKLG